MASAKNALNLLAKIIFRMNIFPARFTLCIGWLALLAMLIGITYTADANSQDGFQLEAFSEPLDKAWAITWLPDGQALVTEVAGKLKRISLTGTIAASISGLPGIAYVGQGGLLDVQIHPDFNRNQRVYLCFSQRQGTAIATALGYGRLEADRLEDFQVIFTATNATASGFHFGCRIRFTDSNKLFMAVGERGARENSQDPMSYPGSIIALTAEGEPHPDNPDIEGWLPEIYAIGIRNPQGLIWDKDRNQLLEHEHGPRGGDELNLIEPGRNYGWPVISYGREYYGLPIGDGLQAATGYTQPLWHWTPSIAPSGMILYQGHAFPNWRGSIFVGSLKFRQLRRLIAPDLQFQNTETPTDFSRWQQEIVINEAPGRVRDVAQGPDGYIYLLIDKSDTPVFRILPANE